jgi:MarR family transcriptional regulator, negative regulator of the multidrug operon emrRAB
VSGSNVSLRNRLGALVVALSDRLRESTEHAAGQSGAGPAALTALHEFPSGRSVEDLRRAVALTPSGAVRLVDRLAAEGLVERRPGRDGRTIALALTPQGRRAARRVLNARAAALTGLLDGLTEQERAALAGIVDKLLVAVTTERLSVRAGGAEIPGGWLCRMCDFAACGRDAGRCPVANTAQRR